MPLCQRVVEPVWLSRHAIPDDIRNDELLCSNNSTLTAIIRQLASLSSYALDIFSDVTNELIKVQTRMDKIGQDFGVLSEKVSKLDPTIENNTLQDLGLSKLYKGSIEIDQEVAARSTLPFSVSCRYDCADIPPQLRLFNQYRADKIDCMKFYSDPGYFFELWKEEMLRDAEKIKQEKIKKIKIQSGQSRQRRGPRPVKDHRAKFREKMPETEFMRNSAEKTQDTNKANVDKDKDTADSENVRRKSKRRSDCFVKQDSLPTPPPTPPLAQPFLAIDDNTADNTVSDSQIAGRIRPSRLPPAPPATEGTPSRKSVDFLPPPLVTDDFLPLPPPPDSPDHFPPPPLEETEAVSSVEPHSITASSSVVPQITPTNVGTTPVPLPPPLPPMPLTDKVVASPNPPSNSPATPKDKDIVSKPPDEGKRPSLARRHSSIKDVKTAADTRSDLLAAIRIGTKLKCVEERKEKEARKTDNSYNDVASILARRIAVEYSDTEEETDVADYDSWNDSDEY